MYLGYMNDTVLKEKMRWSLLLYINVEQLAGKCSHCFQGKARDLICPLDGDKNQQPTFRDVITGLILSLLKNIYYKYISSLAYCCPLCTVI